MRLTVTVLECAGEKRTTEVERNGVLYNVSVATVEDIFLVRHRSFFLQYFDTGHFDVDVHVALSHTRLSNGTAGKEFDTLHSKLYCVGKIQYFTIYPVVVFFRFGSV